MNTWLLYREQTVGGREETGKFVRRLIIIVPATSGYGLGLGFSSGGSKRYLDVGFVLENLLMD